MKNTIQQLERNAAATVALRRDTERQELCAGLRSQYELGVRPRGWVRRLPRRQTTLVPLAAHPRRHTEKSQTKIAATRTRYRNQRCRAAGPARRYPQGGILSLDPFPPYPCPLSICPFHSRSSEI